MDKDETARQKILQRIKFIHVLTVLAITIATVIIFRVMFSDEYVNSELRTQVVTAAIGIIGTAIGFWISSSSDSQRKTDLIIKSQSPKE